MSYIDMSVAATIQFEGSVAWMYLDIDGNVTVAVGKMLPDAKAACALPFQVGVSAATPEQIQTDFERVAAMMPGARASFYKSETSPILLYADIMALLRTVVEANDAAMAKVFQGWSQYPEKVLLGVLDMVYNLGETRLLHEFPQFVLAVLAQHWHEASMQCHRRGISDARNAWTYSMFQT